jgi:hypothetical protein
MMLLIFRLRGHTEAVVACAFSAHARFVRVRVLAHTNYHDHATQRSL